MKIKNVVRQNILELREERGWTQKYVATKLNISQRAYSHYENGSRNIHLEMLVDIATLYDTSISSLLEGDNGRRKA